eukprot:TRINITY_DN6531_c0_g1_i2.p1 TRINITY_DN6531_c0_g1~~TRINITY_DN6531_c0_g1_i2.p1  ORF type:complete len:335 (+),score=62.13 TRINITY_DN6531_c0_g1_i2:697-1701(+)
MVGKGAFGEGYKGWWRGATVAIKVMTGTTKPEEIQQFKNEAALLINLRPHSNVVQFFGVSEIPNLCIITEFLEEGSLDNLLKRESFDNRQFVGMAADIAAGMLHLHKEGIVHRDLATRNLLVKKIQRRDGVDYEVKVTDFGLSRKCMTGTTKADMPLKWSAPESLAEGIYSFKSDVWSFGIVLWEILHKGEEPYADMTVIQIFEGITKRGLRPPVPSTTPRVFHEQMVKSWELSPNDRPGFDVIHHHFFNAIQRNDYSALSPTTMPPPQRGGPVYSGVMTRFQSEPSSPTSSQSTSSGDTFNPLMADRVPLPKNDQVPPPITHALYGSSLQRFT